MDITIESVLVGAVATGLVTVGIGWANNYIKRTYFDGKQVTTSKFTMEEIGELKGMIQSMQTQFQGIATTMAKHEVKFENIERDNRRFEQDINQLGGKLDELNSNMSQVSQSNASLKASMDGLREVLAYVKVPKTRSK